MDWALSPSSSSSPHSPREGKKGEDPNAILLLHRPADSKNSKKQSIYCLFIVYLFIVF